MQYFQCTLELSEKLEAQKKEKAYINEQQRNEVSYSVDVGRRPCLGADGVRKGHEAGKHNWVTPRREQKSSTLLYQLMTW